MSSRGALTATSSPAASKSPRSPAARSWWTGRSRRLSLSVAGSGVSAQRTCRSCVGLSRFGGSAVQRHAQASLSIGDHTRCRGPRFIALGLDADDARTGRQIFQEDRRGADDLSVDQDTRTLRVGIDREGSAISPHRCRKLWSLRARCTRGRDNRLLRCRARRFPRIDGRGGREIWSRTLHRSRTLCRSRTLRGPRTLRGECRHPHRLAVLDRGRGLGRFVVRSRDDDLPAGRGFIGRVRPTRIDEGRFAGEQQHTQKHAQHDSRNHPPRGRGQRWHSRERERARSNVVHPA